MKRALARVRRVALFDLVAAVAFALAVAMAAPGRAEDPLAAASGEESTMKHRIQGSFEVTLTPQEPIAEYEGLIARMLIDKQFQGGLEGSSKGEMLAVRTAVQGSAGYVAMERVTGTLGGRSGSFVLQHSSTMDRGTPKQSIIVIPDSGTDELEGLTGSMVITIEDGKHYYELEYALPAGEERQG